jgi:hypothetical protein
MYEYVFVIKLNNINEDRQWNTEEDDTKHERNSSVLSSLTIQRKGTLPSTSFSYAVLQYLIDRD